MSPIESTRRVSPGRPGVPILAGGIVAIFAACGGPPPQGPAPSPAPAPAPPMTAPAGVDSATAAYADSLAAQALVPTPRREEADRLQDQGRLLVERTDSVWEAMSTATVRSAGISGADSVQAREAAEAGGRALLSLDSLLRDGSAPDRVLLDRTANLLDSAEAALERAYRLNPLDARSGVWLARVYELQARRLGRAGAFDEAADELEKLTLVAPDQHQVWGLLGNAYSELGRWREGAEAYREAARVYLETRDLVLGEPPPLEADLVLGYLRAEGDLHIRDLDAESARQAYRRALALAPSPADTAMLEEELKWLALVEYRLGETQAAAERLQAVVARLSKGPDGRPLDPETHRYLDDYGTLCMNLGRQALTRDRDSRTALAYFVQAARVPWRSQALAHFEVARLLQANPTAALESAGAALAAEDTLSDPQRAELYRLLMDLHRRVGDFARAREFRDAYRRIGTGGR